MIQRVNFLQKGDYALTYRNMLIFAGAVFVLCLMIHGVILIRYSFANAKVTEMKRQLQELNIAKEKTMAALQITDNQPAVKTAPLIALFSKMPVWSSALGSLAEAMPKQVWLERIRSSDTGDPGARKLEIAGRSVSHASIADFAARIDGLDSFKNTMLVNTQKDKTEYTFLINADVMFPKSEW